jgi:hypothetical protein
MFDRVLDQLGIILDAQFFHDPVLVIAYPCGERYAVCRRFPSLNVPYQVHALLHADQPEAAISFYRLHIEASA